ncbi:MAG: hypothetical protein JO061_02680 [Acidobacteriaceae bacterium]|nr:hypothetical protein [Acidobacteriaceae bacterium]
MTVSIQLSDEKTAVLAAKARAQGLSAEQYARQVLERDLEAGAERPPIWEIIAENMRQVPPEDLATLPRDGASQIDHYVYGHPKRD